MILINMILWATITGSLCILLLHHLLKSTSVLLRSGIGFFIFFCILCTLRIFTPLEFASFQHKLEYPGFISFLLKPRYLFHGKLSLEACLLILSLMGTILLGIRSFREIHKMLLTLKKGAIPDDHSTAMLRTIDQNCPVPVFRSSHTKTPVIASHFRPAIYLPDHVYSDEDLYHILLHEYTHWRYHHLTIKLFIHVSTLILWWNPVMRILEKDTSHIIELTCDDFATKNYRPTDRIHYLSSLLQCLKNCNTDSSDRRILSDAYTLGFTSKEHSDTMQRFEYQLNHPSNSRRHPYSSWLLYAASFVWILSSYYFIFQPAYDPENVNSYSNAKNAYVVELENGSYVFHFRQSTVDVPKRDMDSGLYSIYPVIPYQEYQKTGNYKDAKSYKRYLKERSRK